MAMPIFTPGDDPGSSFPELLRRIGAAPTAAGRRRRRRSPTCRTPRRASRMRYADGVVMAGDRRATAGNLISHRSMEKVVEADRHSGVAIAGAAGPAMDMVRLFQLQLEHYEKVEGTPLSLEGKANQLSMMIRGNLQSAMMGLAVVPIFAGYDERRRVGSAVGLRRHRRPLRGARVRRHRLGQPARRHGRQARLPRPTSTATTAIDLACRALWEAADADSATGGPGRPARHLPDRRHDHRRRLGRASTTTSSPTTLRGRSPTTLAHAWRRSAMSMPFYVAPEQVMKDRADYARKGIARGRALVAAALRRRHRHRRREQLRDAAQGQRDLRPHRLRRRRPVQRVRPAARRRRPGRRPQGLPVQPRRRRRPQPRQPVRPDPRPDLHPRDEADGGRDPRRRGRRRRPPATRCSTSSTTARSSTTGTTRCSAATPTPSSARIGESFSDGLDAGGRRAGRRRRARRPRSHAAGRRPRGRPARRGNGRRCFRRLTDDDVTELLGADDDSHPEPDADADASRTPTASRRRT